jgi:prepilin-type N-terminal cleavage/methylation domain-containing protein
MAEKEKGFTLIEILVTLSMVGLIIAAVYNFYLSGLSGWERSTDQVEYQQSARIALDKIVYELVAAKDINIRNQGREIRFSVPGDLRVYRFRLNGPQLVLDAPSTTDQYYTVVALGITDLLFTVEPSGLIKIRVGAGSFDPSTGNPIHTAIFLSSAVFPRNLPVNKIMTAIPIGEEEAVDDE